MGHLFISVAFLSILAQCVCGQTTTTEDPVTRPTLPTNPTYGGRSGNPGTILRLAKNLLLNNVAEGCRETEKKKGSDRSFGDVILPMNNGQLIISHFRLTSLTLPISLSDLQPPSDLLWCTKKGRLTASGTWTYRQNVGNSTVNNTGIVNIPQTTFSALLNTTMGRNSDLQPAITKVSCRVHLDNPKMYFSSARAQSRSAIVGIEANLTEMIEEVLESSMCDLIGIVLQMSLNKFLSTFRTKIQLWSEPKVTLDYSLLADPFVDPVHGSINALLKGSIYVNGASALTIYPHEMPFVTNNTEKSIATMFSDYVLNSLLTTAYQSNALRSIMINNNFSKVIANYLKMDCDDDELCVGSVFPSLSSYPAGAYAEVSLSVSQLPTAVFLQSGAYLQLTGNLLLDIKTVDPYTRFNRYASPFSLIAALTPNVRLEKSNNAVFMEATLLELRLVNAVPMRSRDKVMALMTPILEEVMNKPLRQGIPLPLSMNEKIVNLRNHEFTFFNRALLLSQFV
jgi:hypothetical protein